MKKFAYWIVPVFISVLVLLIVLRLTSWTDFSQVWEQLTWKWVIWGCVFYFTEITLQGLRVNLIFSDFTLPLVKVVSISNLHNFINKVTPARLGELTFPVLFNRYLNVCPVRGLSVLILARLSDLFIVLVAFSLVALAQIIKESLFGFLWILVLLWIGVFLGFGILMNEDVWNQITERIRTRRWPGFLDRIIFRLVDLVKDIGTTVKETRQRKMLLPILSYSLIMWLLIYLVFIVLSWSVNLTFTLSDILIAASFAILGTILPVGGIGHIGNLEAGWTIGLIAAGTDPSNASLSALVIGIMTTSYAALLALFSFLFLEIGFQLRRHSNKIHQQL